VVGEEALDTRLEVTAGNVERARDDPLIPLVLLADVEEERRVVRVEQARAVAGLDLVDLALDLAQELPIGRHCFTKDSD
jgi:hypothetical protein